MDLPRPRDVPATSAVSGVVFVLTMFSVGSPISLLVIFTAWGLMYVTEGWLRRRARARGGRPVEPPAATTTARR